MIRFHMKSMNSPWYRKNLCRGQKGRAVEPPNVMLVDVHPINIHKLVRYITNATNMSLSISMISPLSQSWWLNPNVWWLNKIKSINLCHFPGSRSLAQKKKSITPPSIAPASAAALQHAARALDFEATRGVAPGVVSTNKRWGSTWVNTQNGGFYQETYRKHIENI